MGSVTNGTVCLWVSPHTRTGHWYKEFINYQASPLSLLSTLTQHLQSVYYSAMHTLFLTALSCLLSITASVSTFTPARPPSLPLAVKSPYLSVWLPAGSSGGNGGYLPGQWPQFYTQVNLFQVTF